jgi:hydrogenase nickel incorporation protein HypA/HybF
MHELSIAQSIVDLVRPYVPEGTPVESVRVKVGDLSGVVADSLEFCWSAITPETPLRNARLVIEKIPFRIRCETCGAESESSHGLAVCPQCESPRTRVLSGTELQVLDIELSDQSPVRT